jgi:hypothetical protein
LETRRDALAIVTLFAALFYWPFLFKSGAFVVLVAVAAFFGYRAARAKWRSKHKRELWARFATVEDCGRVAVLDELSAYVDSDDQERLQGLSIDADPEVRRIATRLLHKAIPPPRPPRPPERRGARTFWKIVGSLLLAIGAWRLANGAWRVPDFDTLWLVLAAATIATLVIEPHWACLPALIWLFVVGHFFLLDMWFSPAQGSGWTEALCGGLVVFLVSMREPRRGGESGNGSQ